MGPIILVYLALATAAFLTGLSKGGLGGALGALITPMLALVMPAQVALGVTLPMLMIGDAFALYAHWGGWDWKIVRTVLPSTILGIVVGALVLGYLSPLLLQHGLGLAALAYTAYKLWERRGERVIAATQHMSGWITHITGLFTGIASTIANAGSPVFTIYLLQLRVIPKVFVGTSVLYFAILNALKVPAYLSSHILSFDFLIVDAWIIPLIPFGVWTGILLDRHIDMPTFEKLILGLLGMTGIVLLIK